MEEYDLFDNSLWENETQLLRLIKKNFLSESLVMLGHPAKPKWVNEYFHTHWCPMSPDHLKVVS